MGMACVCAGVLDNSDFDAVGDATADNSDLGVEAMPDSSALDGSWCCEVRSLVADVTPVCVFGVPCSS